MAAKRVAVVVLVMILALTLVLLAAPGALAGGDRICKPGQTNVGGGPGNSGPGDQQGGAPLKPKPSCPGNDN